MRTVRRPGPPGPAWASSGGSAGDANWGPPDQWGERLGSLRILSFRRQREGHQVVDLRPTDEQRQLREALRRLFVDRRLAELVAALPDPPQHDPARALADAMAVGLPALGLPEEHGGIGTFADLVVAHEELGRGLAGPLLPALAAAGRLLLRARGGDRDGLLAALASGQWTAVPAVNGSPGPF